jgi:hypothetical protein
MFKSEQLTSKMEKQSGRGKGKKADDQLQVLDLLSDSDEERQGHSSDEDDIEAILNPEKERSGSLSTSATFASEAIAEENRLRRSRTDLAQHQAHKREQQRAVIEETQPEATAIEIIICRPDGVRNSIKIGTKKKWAVTAANLCNYLKVPRESVEFYFDTLQLDPNKTAEECFIGEGDEIEMRPVGGVLEQRIEAELDEELGEDLAVFALKLKDAAGNTLEPLVTSASTVRDLIDKWEAEYPDQKGNVVLNFDGDNLAESVVLETLDCEEDDLFDVRSKS